MREKEESLSAVAFRKVMKENRDLRRELDRLQKKLDKFAKCGDIEAGQEWVNWGGMAVVLAVVNERYIIARRPSYMPFIVYVKDWRREWTRRPSPTP